eukprot:gnl/TRDRNA2_/TRDRNA2_134765_c0_seq2.p1 gnl/TRDRNA2_/TRDRNA2_134765_c0~~gnl/TRDRNA2_/TRDRNA2_134765_c0_seq2.p1  ORF type:complete len:491 (+),score=126.39 gnl/TRDRNA2_/TRDRNA2_134765_c0_seq2:44-1516(+)
MPKKAGRRKKRRTEKQEDISEKEKRKTPRCFVIKRGSVGEHVADLVADIRQVMQPNCPRKLRESKNNRIEDFTAVAGHFGVSHIIIFSTTALGTYMKVARLPQGPTLTFKVSSFSLSRDVRAQQKRPRSGTRDYTSAPLQVLNGFGGGTAGAGGASSGKDKSKGKSKKGEKGVKDESVSDKALTAEILRGLFPAIDVGTFNQAECRRVVLFHYDNQEEVIHFRHFSVGRKAAGLQRGVSRLLKPGRLPKMGRAGDVADYILGGGGASESEAEDGMEAPGRFGGQVKVRLSEVGPRIELKTVKCEEGVCDGAVLFHRYQKRTETEREVLERKHARKRKLKDRNRKLEEQATSFKKLQNQRKKEKADKVAKQKKAEGEAAGDEPDDSGDEAGGKKGGGPPSKKQRFHPFAWGEDKSKAATKGDAKTVTIDSSSGGGARRKHRGGKNHKDDRRKDAKGGGKGKVGKSGGKSGGKGGRNKKQGVLEKFRSRQRA